MKKFTMPFIVEQDKVPEIRPLIAFVAELTEETYAAAVENVALRKELAQLKKAQARAARKRP
jgi:hypothetical protein